MNILVVMSPEYQVIDHYSWLDGFGVLHVTNDFQHFHYWNCVCIKKEELHQDLERISSFVELTMTSCFLNKLTSQFVYFAVTILQ